MNNMASFVLLDTTIRWVYCAAVLFNDILSSELIGSRTARYVWYPFSEKVYGMYVYTFSRSQRNPSMWLPRRIELTSPNERVVESCCSAINCFVKEMDKRPKYVLVFINPYGGRKRATHVYDHIVAPVFQRAGLKASVMTTKFGGDAKETLMSAFDVFCFFEIIILQPKTTSLFGYCICL